MFVAGSTVHFDARVCNECPQKAKCTTSQKGRSVTLHPQEAQLVELRRKQRRPRVVRSYGKRVTVEHTLARVGQVQGPKAVYWGLRRNLFDVRRAAVIANLFALREAGFAEAA
ncbi:MAG: transposase [Polyangiales bacterium]